MSIDARIRCAAVVAAIVGVAPATAAAQHHHGAPAAAGDEPEAAPFRIGLTALAAHFDTGFYAGDYEGLAASAAWSCGRFGARAALPLYRLQENGASFVGVGDAVVGGDAAILAGAHLRAGVSLAASLPTGDAIEGLGMGHTMLMPAAWAAYGHRRGAASVSLGYGRALATGAHHHHGAWPLVEPMNAAEVTASLGGEVAAWRRLRAGARVAGAVPAGEGGDVRAVAALRAGWSGRSVETAAELQYGLAGDPFTVRGLVETAFRF